MRLSEAPQTYAAVARIMQDVWPDHYGPGGPGDAAGDIAARVAGNALPVGFVALAPDVAGTVALADRSFGVDETDAGPWLIGLAVRDEDRKRGIGSDLVGAVEDYARTMGAKRINTCTQMAQGLLQRRGWTVRRTVRDDAKDAWQVLSKAL